MDSIEEILKKLETDLVINISIINFIKNNRIQSADIIGNSVLARGITDRRWIYISSPDVKELKGVVGHLTPEDRCFGAIEDWMVPVLTEGKEMKWGVSVVKYYLPDEVYLPPPPRKTVSLTADNAAAVYLNSEYREFISMEYAKYCINRGISAGIYEDEKLVSWAITQDDGAIGFLHTLDNYRKKGYAYSITLSMIEKLRAKGKLPFAYAEASNDRSINLLTKLGFRKSSTIHWFEIK